MKSGDLKRAILQHLLKHQGEWTFGKTLGEIFSCNRRQYEDAIELLRFDGYPIIADKGKGYKISFDIRERLDYWDRCEREIRTRLASIKTNRARCESGELFAQDFVIQGQIEKEMVEVNG